MSPFVKKRIHWMILGTASVVLIALAAASPLTKQGGERRVAAQEFLDRAPAAPLSDSAFAKLISRVSEPGGFFDSDNLISNESGYLHPIPKMRTLGVKGGAYLGVGPDQNYSYIAHVRPEIAFMIDIRRDAALQHLLYKVLMSKARNRMEYLCLLFGKPVPAALDKWNSRGLQEIVAYADSAEPRRSLFDRTVAQVRAELLAKRHHVSEFELLTIARIHGEFFRWGMDLQYSSLNRSSRRNYPTFRSLVLERDAAGEHANYLASEENFQFVRDLHIKNLIVPVTGNLAGPHAMREIGRVLEERGVGVSALYTSNVEFYLWREQSFESFADNVTLLPRAKRSVIIRSYFNNGGYYYVPQSRGMAAFSVQLLQEMETFVQEFKAGGYRSYLDVVSKHIIEPR